MIQKNVAPAERLFIGTYPTGLVFADKLVEVAGDYKRLGFLSFTTLVLEIEKSCPDALRAEIIDFAAKVQARGGEDYPVSTSGQTVMLGGHQPPPFRQPFDGSLSVTDSLARAGFVRDIAQDGYGPRYVKDTTSGRRYGPFEPDALLSWLKSAKK